VPEVDKTICTGCGTVLPPVKPQNYSSKGIKGGYRFKKIAHIAGRADRPVPKKPSRKREKHRSIAGRQRGTRY